MAKFTIFGDPIPKARHRTRVKSTYGTFRKGRMKVMAYDPQSEKKRLTKHILEDGISEMLNSSDRKIVIEASKLASGEAFKAEMTFHMPIPESTPQWKRNLMLWGFIDHNKKPDTSNLIKFYEDAANEILFRDDSMIVEVKGKKVYSETPRTEIIIMANKKYEETEEGKILSIYGPNQLQDLVDSCAEIHKEYTEYMHRKIDEPYNEFFLHTMTKFLSKLADGHADLLKNVKKKSEGYWKKEVPQAQMVTK